MSDYPFKHAALTGKIIGCVMTVHRTLGKGFPEVIYQRALAIEMELAGISFKSECSLPVYYRDIRIGSRRVDFLVEDLIPVELKAISELDDASYAQAFNYIEACKREIGLLVNFGKPSLHFKRLRNKQFDRESPE